MPTNRLSGKSYLRSLARIVCTAEVERLVRRSPDDHRYRWDYLRALTRPLESGEFPGTNLRDLNFALGNLLVHLESVRNFKPSTRLYVASLYLYVNHLEPAGIQLTETAVRVALENLLDDGDRERVRLFEEFLIWLLDRKVNHNEAENYFLRLAILIVRGEISEVDESEFKAIEANLPSWIRGVNEVKLLSSDPGFPKPWNRLLRKMRVAKNIKPLLGMGHHNGSNR